MNYDEYWMRKALEAAEFGRGQTTPNPLVGAVIVKDGEVVGQGAHLRAGGPHAEVHALNMAGEQAAGATVYVTLEPCSHYGRTPPCAKALIEAGVKRVVVASADPNDQVNGQGIRMLREAGIDVTVGVCADAADQLNEAFFTLMRTGRPFVIWKCAATLDGYTAAETGHSQYVTSPEARHHVQWLRRDIPAIAVGVGTVLADDPKLTVRIQDEDNRQPLRVVFDSKLRMQESAAMLQEPGHTLIYTTASEALQTRMDGFRKVCGQRAEVAVMPDEDGRVSLDAALKDLGARGISSVLVEGGATLASSLFNRGYIDKVVYFLAPKLLGGGLPALAGLHPLHMNDAVHLTRTTWAAVGSDLCLTGYPQYNSEGGDSTVHRTR